MSDSTETVSIWSAAWFKSRSSIVGFFSFFLSQVLSSCAFIVSLIDGIAAFFTFLYTAIPPIAYRVLSAFQSCSEFVTGLFTTTSAKAVEDTSAVVGIIEENQIVENSSSLWDIVKYCINVDALADFLNFVVSIGWLWIFLVVLVLFVCTGFLLAGAVIHVTRRFIVFISAGFVNVS